MLFSIIIPVYNRPDEVKELLESLSNQSYKEFEVLLIEDGSTIPCEHIQKEFINILNLRYFYKSNTGPGLSRNYGAARACGDYLLFFDSDCIIPPDYLRNVYNLLISGEVGLFGGPDAGSDTFTPIQQAINYSMTSFLTTGGIRGGKNKLDRFYPRTFNLGVKKKLFAAVGGFADMRFGEDLDFSIRMIEKGYVSAYCPEAWVYHKRRSTLQQFFKQVHNSGRARINLYKKYPHSLKIVHALPALFVIGTIFLAGLTFYKPVFMVPLLLCTIFVLADAFYKTRHVKITCLSVVTSFTQLIGYGTGFLIAWWGQCVLHTGYKSGFDKTFYK